MHRIVFIIAMAGLISPAALGQELSGDELAALEMPGDDQEWLDELAFLQEADMVESAARHRQVIGMSPSAITVLTRADIETSGATTLPDLLRLVPGMGVIISTPYYGGAVGRLPWTNDAVSYLVLIDGRQANIEILGIPALETQPIFLEDIERMEIIRGPGSSLYGANAFAGVISITTRAVQEKTSAWIGFSGGEAGYLSAGARASAMVGGWGISVSGGGDVMGTIVDPRAEGRRVWKLRSVVERRFGGSKRLVIDAGISRGEGPLATMMGMIDSALEIRNVRVAYGSDTLKAQLYWVQVPVNVDLIYPLDYGGVRLARFVPAEVDGHIVDAEVQWTLPEFREQLLIIVGASGRFAWFGSDQMLDAETFADPASPDYHKVGISQWEMRTGAFVHAELTPADWVTVTGGVRFDYNTETHEFFSPRLAMVFQPVPDHFVRLSVARAFRKPCVVETRTHPGVSFPPYSPIQGPEQDRFLEFMTRVLGNSELENEELVAYEFGYLAQLLEGKLVLSFDLYYNLFSNEIHIETNIIPDEMGLPDLELSSVQQHNSEGDIAVLGSELSARLELTDSIQLLASWSQRYIVKGVTWEGADETPQHMITLGGRFRTSTGLLGSLYAHSRSEFVDRGVLNPAGVLSPPLVMRMENVVLLIGKLGWAFKPANGVNLEAGIRLSQPISLAASPGLCFREEGGGTTLNGVVYGGMELCRMLTGYLQGSF
jgi:iron complex outermembrane receptor protein